MADNDPRGSSAINRQTGLAQYEGDESIYEDILGRFARSNAGALKKLRGAIDRGDTELAHRTAHSLRGAAGTIGAERLADAALRLEKTLAPMRDGGTVPAENSALDELLMLLEAELESVFSELGAVTTGEEEICKQPANMDREKTIGLIDKLLPFLETGDTKCLEYLDEIEHAFRPAAEAFLRFIVQMELYDFEQASDTAKELLRFMTP